LRCVTEFEGRVPEVYEEWKDCKKHVVKFSGNCYKRYATRQEVVAKWRNHQSNKNKIKTFVVFPLLLTIVTTLLYFALVSAVVGDHIICNLDDEICTN
jgi:hypothetical protein